MTPLKLSALRDSVAAILCEFNLGGTGKDGAVISCREREKGAPTQLLWKSGKGVSVWPDGHGRIQLLQGRGTTSAVVICLC